MSKATEDFKALLVRNKGKMKAEHMPKIIGFVDSYINEFTVGGEKELVQRLLGEAFDMEPQRLQDIFECGTRALASFKDDFTPLIPDDAITINLEVVGDSDRKLTITKGGKGYAF